MSLITRSLRQRMVYWAAKTGPGANDRSGKRLYEEPVEVACRWTDGEDEQKDKYGREEPSNAYILVRSTSAGEGVAAFPVGGFVRLGSLSEVEAIPDVELSDPMSVDGAWEITKRKATPNRTAREFLIELWV